jgi:predicted N-acyltransferase
VAHYLAGERQQIAQAQEALATESPFRKAGDTHE